MTRQDLIDILKMDNVLDEFENAVQEKELTLEEQTRIYDFLRSESKEESQRIFEDILADIDSKDVHSNLNEELKSWREERRELANDIKELKNRTLDTKDEILRVEDEISSAHNFVRPVELKPFEEKLDNEYARLDIETKQLSALSLMHANARTMEAQVRGQIFKEATEPLRSSLKHEWENLRGFTRDSYVHIRNAKEARNRTDRLASHPIKDALNKINISWTKYHIKNFHQSVEKIDKVEQKILAKANKIDKAEFRKDQFINKLDAWSKGQVPEKITREQITDVNKAKEIVKDSNRFNEHRLKLWQKTLDKLNSKRVHHIDKGKEHLERVSSDLRNRRAEIQREAQDISQKLQNGELGKATYTMGVVEKNFEQAQERAYLNESEFSKEELQFLHVAGYSHIVYEGMEAIERPENEPKIETPEQVFDQETHDAFVINEDGQVHMATPEEVQEILENQNQEQVQVEPEEITFDDCARLDDVEEELSFQDCAKEYDDPNPTNLFNDEIEIMEQEQVPERE